MTKIQNTTFSKIIQMIISALHYIYPSVDINAQKQFRMNYTSLIYKNPKKKRWVGDISK